MDDLQLVPQKRHFLKIFHTVNFGRPSEAKGGYELPSPSGSLREGKKLNLFSSYGHLPCAYNGVCTIRAWFYF